MNLRFTRWAVAVSLTAAVVLSAQLGDIVYAASDEDRCGLAVGPLCRVLPVAPGLEGDVDLTIEAPEAPFVLLPENAVPVDPCAMGCI